MLIQEERGNLVTKDKIRAYLLRLFSFHMNVTVEELDNEESFFSLGLTSMIQTEIHSHLSTQVPDLSSVVLFEYPNLDLLTDYLYSQHNDVFLSVSLDEMSALT